MKTKSKALLLTLCAVLLVAASVMGTMAYLTSTDKVENTFTVGNVKITLDEAKVNTDGTPVNSCRAQSRPMSTSCCRVTPTPRILPSRSKQSARAPTSA